MIGKLFTVSDLALYALAIYSGYAAIIIVKTIFGFISLIVKSDLWREVFLSPASIEIFLYFIGYLATNLVFVLGLAKIYQRKTSGIFLVIIGAIGCTLYFKAVESAEIFWVLIFVLLLPWPFALTEQNRKINHS